MRIFDIEAVETEDGLYLIPTREQPGQFGSIVQDDARKDLPSSSTVP